MTETMTAPETQPQPMAEVDKFASKILAFGGAVVSGIAAFGIGKSAGALLLGYATYGAALPLLGYAGVFVASRSLMTYHAKKLGLDKAPGDTAEATGSTPSVPEVNDLKAGASSISDEIGSLNARADELARDLGHDHSGPAMTNDRNHGPRG